MERRFAAIILAVVAAAVVVVVGWVALRPATGVPDAVSEVARAAPEREPEPPVPPEPAQAEAPHPWNPPVPTPPERPEAEPGTWSERRAQAHEAWRARSLQALAHHSEAWTGSERAAVTAATETLIDSIGTARVETAAGQRTPAQLREATAAARAHADFAFRAAVGERADEVWAVLDAASAPI